MPRRQLDALTRSLPNDAWKELSWVLGGRRGELYVAFNSDICAVYQTSVQYSAERKWQRKIRSSDGNLAKDRYRAERPGLAPATPATSDVGTAVIYSPDAARWSLGNARPRVAASPG